MKWLDARDLDRWSDRLDARNQLPELVGQLIRASAKDISSLRFPSGNAGNVRGFDGHLISNEAGLNVPEGESFWEMKTSEDAWGEGLKDFRKRSDQLTVDERARSTFVFVSSRLWDTTAKDRKIEDWVKKAKAECPGWKDVRCIDASVLEDWFAASPPVAANFARYILKLVPPTGARSTDEFWDEYRHGFGPPPLVEEVLLCDRAKEVEQLIEALLRQDGLISFVSDSPDEVTAFAVAAIRHAKSDVRAFLEARTIIVDNMEAGRRLVSDNQFVYLVRGDAASTANYFAEKGPTLVPLGDQRRGTGQVLERPTAPSMGAALEKMGFDHATAFQIAREVGRSITALRRRISKGDVPQPKWLEHIDAILPAILAGGWDAKNELDKAALAALAHVNDYNTFERGVRPFISSVDPPLDRNGTIWTVRAPREAFIYAGDHIGPDVLATFESVLLSVFSYVPPTPNPDAMFRVGTAPADGHSLWLRNGLATTLLEIAVWDKLADIDIPGGGQRFANDLVNKIPGLAAHPGVLLSLREQLPLLAEAAPDPLLSALERMLEGNSDPLRAIFVELEGPIYPVSQHTHILWALEILAWDPEYFARATIILGRLATLDLGGTLTNRPINSLGEIFLPWHPSTQASLELRLSVLKKVCLELPEIGWQLVSKMLPTMHGIAVGTVRPKLRDAGSGEVRVTYGEVWRAQSAAVRLGIDLADTNPERWQTLIQGIASFQAEDRTAILARLEELLPRLSNEHRKPLWETMKKELDHHERYPTAKWALSAEQLAPLKTLVDRYAPTDPIENARLVFEGWMIDAEGRREPVDHERQTLLRNILDVFGAPGLVRLGMTVKQPYSVIEQLDRIAVSQSELESAADLTVDEHPPELTYGLLRVLHAKYGQNASEIWIRRIRDDRKISDGTIGRLLTALPDSRETWDFAKSLGADVEESYWKNKRGFWLIGSRENLLEAIAMYLRFGRGTAALETAFQRMKEVPSELFFDVLDTIFGEMNSGGSYNPSMISYELEKLFGELSTRADVTTDDLARREIMFFPILEHTQYRMRVFQAMAEDPELYFQAIKGVFRADNEPERKSRGSEAERAAWRISYSLLTNFDEVPGMNAGGIQSGILSNWIDRLRGLARAEHRSAITDQYIGHVLAHAPAGADAVWPPVEVRDQIERLQSVEIERGISIERFNMRGVHTRGVYDGGDQERELAALNERFAKSMAKWPRTEALMRRMAKQWEAEALREDELAAQRKISM